MQWPHFRQITNHATNRPATTFYGGLAASGEGGVLNGVEIFGFETSGFVTSGFVTSEFVTPAGG